MGGLPSVLRARYGNNLETARSAKTSFFSLTGPATCRAAGSPFSGMFSLFVRVPLPRTASTLRRETGPEGPSPAGSNPPGGALELRVRLANRRGRRPCRPAGRGPRRGSRTGPPPRSRSPSCPSARPMRRYQASPPSPKRSPVPRPASDQSSRADSSPPAGGSRLERQSSRRRRRDRFGACSFRTLS